MKDLDRGAWRMEYPSADSILGEEEGRMLLEIGCPHGAALKLKALGMTRSHITDGYALAFLTERITVKAAPFGMDFVFSVYYLAAPLLLIDLKASPIELGLVGTLAAVMHMALAHLTGRISDRLGRRRLVVAAPLVFSATCLIVTQLREIWHILALSVINGCCLAVYWPSLQAWIADRGEGRELAQDIGSFNMSWTSATLAGPLISGALYGLWENLPFMFAAAVSLLLFVLVSLTVHDNTRRSDQKGSTLVQRDTNALRPFLYAAWAANFASWFIMGNARYQFPKLASALNMPPYLIGLVFSSLGLALFMGFFLLRRTERWHFRKAFLLGAQLSSLMGLFLMTLSEKPVLFALSFILMGASCSVTYYSSLFYSVSVLDRRGKGSGLHESILGIGAVLGPLLGGIAAQCGGLRAPYLLCASVVALSLVVQYNIIRKMR
jgi:MFS family permease